ncbi:MAG TPA: hypothetical protein VKN99_02140 [Polyangia bacterium]|nr:hypothetical protein [Polyangia bacterium]
MRCSQKYHRRIKRNLKVFRRFTRFVAVWLGVSGPALELRDCPHCSSTLAMRLVNGPQPPPG